MLVIGGAGAFGYSLFQNRTPPVYAITLPAGEASTTPLTYGSWPALADEDFYEKVKAQFIDGKASFIVADLQAMQLTLYQDGLVALQVPIVAKGKVGSWWETPAGLYKVETREEKHFSSFGEVYMPWSLDFQGNFFIHGIPYYPDGTPVSSSYSGGCIRLATADAQALYEFAKVGMPVLVYNAPPKLEAFQYKFKTPDIEAASFAAADLGDGTILAGDDVSVQLPIASVTKLMTALVAVEYLNLERTVAVQQSALVSSVVPRLSAGQQYRIYDLLILMLTESSNEASEVIASALGRQQFVSLMNKKAAAIGMKRTSFVDPSGLGTGNSSTAEDLFTFIKYLYQSRQFILDVTNGTFDKSIYGAVAFKNLQNFNPIEEVPNVFLGGKVGTTNAARETYLGIFGLSVEGEERPVAVVVLGSGDSHKSVVTLLKYLNEFYELNPKSESAVP
jgi:D-alanyl-D-alanine carboxypeptidase